MTNEAANRTARSWPGRRRRQQRSYRAYHDAQTPGSLSTTVVHALADAMEVDVTDVEFSLADSIDPEALDRLFASGADRTAAGHVAFTVEGYSVTVYSGGEIVITPPVH